MIEHLLSNTVKIGTNYDTKKISAMLLVVFNNKLLLQKLQLEGETIVDTFGTFVGEADPLLKLMDTQRDNLGTSYELQTSGTVQEYINKPFPDGRVLLTTYTYVLALTQDQHDMLLQKDNWLWMDTEEIETDKAIRSDDKLIFTRVLESKTLNLILEVDQLGTWIDAKLLAWSVRK